MKIVAKKLGRSDRLDRICCIREDGSTTEASMPRQGIAPHDLLHWLVETHFGFVDGFLGAVAKGAEIAFVMQKSHDATRGSVLIEAAQAEAIVESPQAQLWNGSFDSEAFSAGVNAACAMREVPGPALETMNIEDDLFQPAQRLGKQWAAQPYYSEMPLVFG